MSTSSFVSASLVSVLIAVTGCSRAPSNGDTEAQPIAVMPARVAPTPAPTPVTVTAAPTPITASTPAPTVTSAAPAVATSSAGLTAKRVVVTRKIAGREPVAGDPLVAEAAPLFAFVELSNASAEEQKVFVTFESKEGLSVGHVQLSVPASARRWRTWARTTGVRHAGEWTAVVRGVDGKELGRESFEVTAAPQATPAKPVAASTTPPSASFPTVATREGSSKSGAGS